MKIDCIGFTDAFADAAFLFFKVDAAVVYIGDQRDGLGEIDVDRFVLRDFLVEYIRVFNRAVFRAGCTTRALILDNVAGLFCQGNFKVSRIALNSVNFGVGKNLYVRMPADLDQFG